MASTRWWKDVVAAVGPASAAGPLPGAAFGFQIGRQPPLLGAVGEGWTPQSIVGIGSISKALVATTVLDLIESKRTPFPQAERTPLRSLFPEAGFADFPKSKQNLTLWHLLTHTSGFPYFCKWTETARDEHGNWRIAEHYRALTPPGDLAVGSKQWLGSPGLTGEGIYDYAGRNWVLDGRRATVGQIGAFVLRLPLLAGFKVGRQFQYSNFGYGLLAHVVEAVSHRSYNSQVRRAVFDRIGMHNSFHVMASSGDPDHDTSILEAVTPAQIQAIPPVRLISSSWPAEVADPLVGNPQTFDVQKRLWRNVWPEGGCLSTVEDLLKFLGMLRDGGQTLGTDRVLSPPRARLMIEDRLPRGVVDPSGQGHSLGLFVKRSSEATTRAQPEHFLPVGSAYHLGRFMTFAWITPNANPDRTRMGVFLSHRLTRVADDGDVAAGTERIAAFVEAIGKAGQLGG